LPRRCWAQPPPPRRHAERLLSARQCALTLAARYTHNKFDFVDTREGPIDGPVRTKVNANQSEGAFTPKFGVSYHVDQANMLYAHASKIPLRRSAAASQPRFLRCRSHHTRPDHQPDRL
jgi:hypothetical protein